MSRGNWSNHPSYFTLECTKMYVCVYVEKKCFTILQCDTDEDMKVFNTCFAELTMQPYQPPAPAPNTVNVQPQSASTYPGYSGSYSKIFGGIQIVCGILTIICHWFLISIESAAMFSGAGIWFGIMVSGNCQCLIICTEPWQSKCIAKRISCQDEHNNLT